MAASTGSSRPLAFVEDTAVPPENLAAYVAEFAQMLDRHGLRAGFYGHLSVGCLHIRPFVDLREPAQIETMRTVAEEVLELVLRYDGVNSSEHGDGLVRSEFNRRVFGEELYEAMREVKRLFDPEGRLNPGKMVDARGDDRDLRDPALPAPAPLATHLRFAGPEGMRARRGPLPADRRLPQDRRRRHVPLLHGHARGGARHARARQRARASALSQPDPRAALGDERLHGILDLCLACKACKSECPLSVDMAALKTEASRTTTRSTGRRCARARSARSARLNRLGAATAPLSNLAAGLKPLKSALGIAPQRPLPRFERESLTRWYARRPKPGGPFPRGDVVFLADSFTTFTEPAIGRACDRAARARRLAACGWRRAAAAGARASPRGARSRRSALARASMVERLAPDAERGVPIVGCEPSCLLTLREELSDLLPATTRAPRRSPARRSSSPSCSSRRSTTGRSRCDPRSEVAGRRDRLPRPLPREGAGGTKSSVELLRRMPGADVHEIDGGCCGMAGSFGFEAEHYDLSMRIGSLRLFPAIAAEAGDCWSPPPASPAASRSRTAWGTGHGILSSS